ncbi:IclR family transcriptional regulator [Rhodoligotrophos defluvii]|uniref:IclR family transcriptional regulator n=1 Tax=Rhodoligotrophos defluvii TaxID=2561934 RepID=UPI0014855500|nr:IclR family transcriptional regulator [Rhodoligotrophos defluvii]
MKTSSRNPISKALKALTWMVQENAKDVGVREMAAGLNVSPSTAHRLLSELVQADLVNHNPQTGRYSLSLEFLRLAYLAIAQMPIRQIALAHMRQLTDACNETSLLGLYDSMRQEMIFAAMVESSHPLRYQIELNKWLPVYVGASGLAIMSFLSDTEIASIIDRTRLAPATSRSITERYRLEAEIQRIRERGYAITHGQRTVDAVGIAAPVFGSSGEAIGDICLTIPESRFDPSTERRIAELLMDCADKVTKSIGGKRRVFHPA